MHNVNYTLKQSNRSTITINVGSTALLTINVSSTAVCQTKLCLDKNNDGNTTLVTYIVYCKQKEKKKELLTYD